jgi:hypothetical protein
MSAPIEELGDIALGDARLNRRARRLLQRLGDKPTVSIPAACGGWSETRAAYRLFDHPQVTAGAVLAPHIARTVERMRTHPRVLCIQDTSELDYTGKPSMQGLGPLNLELRQGLYLHPTLALTPGIPGHASPAVSARTRIPTAPWRRRKACAGWTVTNGSTSWPRPSPTPA